MVHDSSLRRRLAGLPGLLVSLRVSTACFLPIEPPGRDRQQASSQQLAADWHQVGQGCAVTSSSVAGRELHSRSSPTRTTLRINIPHPAWSVLQCIRLAHLRPLATTEIMRQAPTHACPPQSSPELLRWHLAPDSRLIKFRGCTRKARREAAPAVSYWARPGISLLDAQPGNGESMLLV